MPLSRLGEAGRKLYSLTDAGRRYARRSTSRAPGYQDGHRAVLREQLAAQHGELARTSCSLLTCSANERSRDLRLRRRVRPLPRAGFAHRAVAGDQNFESQGSRYRKLLEEAGLTTETNEVTESGASLLRDVGAPAHTPVASSPRSASPSGVVGQSGFDLWQGAPGRFLWPDANKANRPQRHWDAMDEVRRDDIICTTGRLPPRSQRRPGPRSAGAQPSRHRRVATRWPLDRHSVPGPNDPVPRRYPGRAPRAVLGALHLRGLRPAGYLYPVDGRFADELADRFPELRDILGPVGLDPDPEIGINLPRSLDTLWPPSRPPSHVPDRGQPAAVVRQQLAGQAILHSHWPLGLRKDATGDAPRRVVRSR